MKRTALGLAAIAVTGLSLTACGDTKVDTATSPSSHLTLPATSSAAAAPSASATTPATAATNSRGNIVKQLGQTGGVFGPDGATDEISFAVDTITPDPKCDNSYSSPPENGHLVQLQLRVTTSAQLTASSYDTLSSNDFKFIGSDGVTKSDLGTPATFECFQSDRGLMTQDAFGPSQSYTGYEILDVPEATGTIIFQPSWGQTGGWEYTF